MNPDQDDFNMINGGPEDDFERMLRRQLQNSTPYVPDEGFSAQVLAALPAARAQSRWRERLMIGVPVLIISLLVFSQLPWLEMTYIVQAWIQGAMSTSWTLLAALAAGAFSLLTAGCYWYFADEK
jgi:predicted anti-sigma-YlaC factor YlaD